MLFQRAKRLSKSANLDAGRRTKTVERTAQLLSTRFSENPEPPNARGMSNVLSIHVVLVAASVVRRERRMQGSKAAGASPPLTAALIDLDVIFPTFGIDLIFTPSR
jgi:hypothetical protein